MDEPKCMGENKIIEKPECCQYRKFDKESEFCVSHCKYNVLCSKGELETDEILKLRIKKNRGEISFKEFVEKGMKQIKKNAVYKERVPMVDIYKMPKVDDNIKKRMDWTNK